MKKHLERSSATYWLATVDRDRDPQVRPILAVWVHGGELHFCSGAATRKAKNLALDPHCVVAVEHEPLDLVMRVVKRVRDASTLQDIANAYAEIYDWHVTVRDGAFHDAGGAPTAGPPPYEAYAFVPTTAFVFGLDETVSPTRLVFAEASA